MAKKPSSPAVASTAPSGAPRWTYGLTAVVGAVVAVWAVVSHFVPKAEAVKPVVAAAASVPAASGLSPLSPNVPPANPVTPSVVVIGGGIGIGTMSGGTIHSSRPPAASAATP
jgi:hypothetical protein